MRTRIAAAMIALALLLFPLGAFMIVSRCFDLTMAREREPHCRGDGHCRAVAWKSGTEDG